MHHWQEGLGLQLCDPSGCRKGSGRSPARPDLSSQQETPRQDCPSHQGLGHTTWRVGEHKNTHLLHGLVAEPRGAMAPQGLDLRGGLGAGLGSPLWREVPLLLSTRASLDFLQHSSCVQGTGPMMRTRQKPWCPCQSSFRGPTGTLHHPASRQPPGPDPS